MPQKLCGGQSTGRTGNLWTDRSVKSGKSGAALLGGTMHFG